MSGSLIARGLTFHHGSSVVLDGVSFTVSPTSRIGVVAPNGTGKTTLLRILAGELSPDAGSVTRSPLDASVGFARQERESASAMSARELISTKTGVGPAEAEMAAAAVALGEGGEEAGDRYADALEHWLALGGGDFEARLASVCAEIGLDDELLERPSGALSGGEAARVSLAVVALMRHDIVLLDEPTNDLDLAGLALLERFVATREGGVVLVSHDRAFLEATVTSVLEIDEHTHAGRMFEGGWSAYLAERDTARAHAEEDHEKFARQRDELEERARRQREWANVGVRKAAKKPSDNDKSARAFRQNRTEKLASKVRISERAISRLETVDKPWEGWQLDLVIESGPRSGDSVCVLSSAVVERGGFRLGPVDLELSWADRVAVLGPNGAGKSTLIDTILGRNELASGSRRFGSSVVIGELDQTRGELSGDDELAALFRRVLRERTVGEEMPQSEQRSLLAKFGLSAPHLSRRVSSLSPGERTRVYLALFMAVGVNLLVLDEPTNHLDLPAIEQLESALRAYDGTLLLVTHDRRLLEAVPVTRTLFVDSGQVLER